MPAKVICIKVDYAEATGTHNTQNANFVEKLYSEPIPPQAEEPKCRTTIYGKPILLFHQEDLNSDPVFYGKGNYNYDKGAEYVFGFTDKYDVECWEFCNNTSDACNFLGEIPDAWGDDFEARYPEETKEIGRFKEMHDWVVSTRRDTATGAALAEAYVDADGITHTNDTSEYRLAKFKMEFEDHFDMHYSLIYYVYTFFALMVDQRAKNMFLTYWGSTGKWQPWFYDNDTCFGINNEGQLVLDYYHEDTDQLEGANVYNGQNSVLWCNFRDAFPDKIKETYQDLRSNSVLNYDELHDQFITQGSDKWSESVYNEDADFKYISMLETDNDASNLGQVRGTGEEHLRYFLENRLMYCDSKWYATDYADDYVGLRIYTPQDENGNPRTDLAVEANADITVTPFSHIYAGVRYKANGTLYQERVEANEEVTFEAPDEVFNDTETAIYGASQLSSLGDLSPLYCGSINISKATKLTELIVGNNTEGYSNPNLNDLSVGTNYLLKKLNVRNCPKLTDPLALTGCPNIEEIYAGGSGITGIELADSGYLKVVELPATIKNLTFKNQLYIEALTLEGYDAIKTIQIENCPTIDALDILSKSANIERVRLTNLDLKYDTAAELLALSERSIGGIDENGTNTDMMWIDGKCHIKELTGNDYAKIKMAFPYLTITYTTLESTLIYMSEDGTTELNRETVYNGGDGTCPVTAGTIETPTKESTAQYDFTFGGWSLKSGGDVNSNALSAVEADRTVYAAFNKTIRSYTVNFYNGTTLLETHTVEYGSDATYGGETPVHPTLPDDMEFTGWKPEPTNIQGNTDCYAQWYDLREITDDWATIAQACLDGTATEKYAIGSYKPVEITHEDGTVETIPMEVIGHNHDELTDGVNKWESVETLPFGVIGYANFTFERNNVLYLLTNKLWSWNGTEWAEITTVPTGVTTHIAAMYNDELYIYHNTNITTATHYCKLYKYDWTEWTEVTTLPDAHFNGAMIEYNGYLHFIGGNYIKTHHVWDGTTWIETGNYPLYAQKCGGVVYKDEIHIFTDSGGNHYKYDGNEWSKVGDVPWGTTTIAVSAGKKVEVYDDCIYVNTSGNGAYKWDGINWEVANMPSNYDLKKALLLAFNNELHLLGGQNSMYKHWKWSRAKFESVGQLGMSMYSEEFVFDIDNELHVIKRNAYYKYDGYSWTNMNLTENSDIDTSHLYIAYYNGTFYAIKNVSTNAVGDPIYKYDGATWVESGLTLPYPFYSGGIVVYNNELHLIGGMWAGAKCHYKWDGVDGSGFIEVGTLPASTYSTVFVYNNELHFINTASPYNMYKYDGESWTLIGPTVGNGHYKLLTEMNGSLYYMWGTSLYQYDGTAWSYVSELPYECNSANLVSFRNKLYMLGGVKNDKQLYAFRNPRATLTFFAKEAMAENRQMYELANLYGCWADSDLRYWLNNNLYSILPSSLQPSIKNVLKVSDGGRSDWTVKTTEDKIWLACYDEVGGSESNNNVLHYGDVYPIFTDNDSRLRHKADEETGMQWWLRNFWSTGAVSVVNAKGIAGGYSCVVNRTDVGTVFGFCI